MLFAACNECLRFLAEVPRGADELDGRSPVLEQAVCDEDVADRTPDWISSERDLNRDEQDVELNHVDDIVARLHSTEARFCRRLVEHLTRVLGIAIAVRIVFRNCLEV